MHLAQAFNQRACVLILLEVLHAGKKIIMASMHDEIHFYEFNYRVTCSHLKKRNVLTITIQWPHLGSVVDNPAVSSVKRLKKLTHWMKTVSGYNVQEYKYEYTLWLLCCVTNAGFSCECTSVYTQNVKYMQICNHQLTQVCISGVYIYIFIYLKT